MILIQFLRVSQSPVLPDPGHHFHDIFGKLQLHQFRMSDKASKLILEKVRSFDDMPRELWIQFDSREDYAKAETDLVDDLMESKGNSTVVIYLKDVKAMKKLPPSYQVHIEDSWLDKMCEKYGSSNVKIVERVLKNL